MLRTVSVLAVLSGAVFAEGEEESDVLVLTDDNFDEVISSTERVVVEFYAPWCGHCKALAPEYEKAATQLKTDGSVTKLAKVDATEWKDLASKYGVRGYPTLKYFVNGGEPEDYTGGRTADTIVSWVNKRELPALNILEDEAAVTAFAEKQGVALVAITSDDSKKETMKQIAETMRDQIATGLQESSEDKLIVYRNFEGEDQQVTFDSGSDWTVESITAFVNRGRFPLFGEINQENFGGYMERGLPLAWVALNTEDEATLTAAREAFVGSGAAKSVSDKVSIVYIDNGKYGSHVQNIGIDSVPGMIVIQENDKWKFTGDVTSSSDVSGFFTRWAAGEVEKFLKSEDTPEDPIEEEVYKVVGNTFSDVVNQDKDVLMEFYAPWCGHCKKLAPDYVKVATAFKSVSDVVIAKIDATANDTPEEIRGFPTLIFYAKGKGIGEGVKYEGARTAKAIVEWIEERTSTDTASLDKTEL